MKLWFRKLARSFDGDAYRYIVDFARTEGEQRAQMFRDHGIPRAYAGDGHDEAAIARIAGLVSAPHKVDVEEGRGTPDELRKMLAAGVLMESDLVSHDGATWSTFRTHEAFYEVASEAADRRARKRRCFALLIVAIFACGAYFAVMAAT